MDTLLFKHSAGHMLLGERVLIMGILNVTPDSFSDGGNFFNADAAIARGLEMAADGADIIDIGGESTRPGSQPVPEAEEIRRTVPVIRALCADLDLPVSIDTTKAAVARAALEAGAVIVNDVSGLQRDPGMLDVLRETGAGCVVMHMRGVPGTMQTMTEYENLVGEICACLQESIQRAVAATGLSEDHFMVDPGIGFAKTTEQNLELIARCRAFREFGRPVLLGPSKKAFVGRITGREVASERLWGTAAAVAACVLSGADVVRVHNVAEMRDVVRVSQAIRDAVPMASQ